MATEYDADIVMYVAMMGLCPTIALFGIVSNIINIIIFIKTGFSESITVSLLGLAISDLLALVFVVPFIAFSNPIMLHSDDHPFNSIDVIFLAITFPYSAFTRITCLITAFVTIERCLCFVLPLRVKTLLTPRRSAIVICAIFAITLCTLIPPHLAAKLDWRHDTRRNKTIYGLVFKRKDSAQLMEIRTIMTLSIQLFSFFALVVSNIALAITVKRQAKWRASSGAAGIQQNGQLQQNSVENAADSTMSRNRRLARMIQLLSFIQFVTFLPSTLFYLVALGLPEFSMYGKYRNEYKSCWPSATVLQCLNSSLNIIFYYRMNTRFRNRMAKMFKKGATRIFPANANTMDNTVETISQRPRPR
ncbi:chemosensory receptor a [Plakobranchus ocellatus]|uniref:Chemosensory receptor a n=1 Tax=Plakobranchus ocellatus TaxID=259542 RepID=A0AAV4A7E6_9GAST|nr:chemosensory receptor a [Plakobranchus ocellatus]